MLWTGPPAVPLRNLRHSGTFRITLLRIVRSWRALSVRSVGMSDQDGPATQYSAAVAHAAAAFAAAESAAQVLAESLDPTVPAALEARSVVELVAAAGRALTVAVEAKAEVVAAALVAAEEARQTEARLNHELLHDGLTGLPNKRLLVDRLTQALARAKRAGTHVAVLFLDLDGFKTVNDTLGHAVGDQLLIGVAKRLQESLRDTDTCARVGGDEFVVVLEDVAQPSDGSMLCGRLEMALARGVAIGDLTMPVYASVGIAVSSLGSLTAELLDKADAAMYRAKGGQRAPDRRAHGGGTEVVVGPGSGMPRHARRRGDRPDA